ncbi:hypothetical protein [Neobacillus vireti]|uniref:hypothetical protein n=1 Tax=Neobacillus vireti TaxID=220686 RepID=UPI002FFEE9EE
MIQLLIEYKWTILIICETAAWLTTFYMLYARYWLKSKIQFYIFGAFAIITGYVPHLTIGILDFIRFQKLDGFTMFIIILFIFGFTFGKKLVTKMDLRIQNWVNRQRESS